MREPVGTCRYCGQEFMRRQSLAVHEAEKCPERPQKADTRPKAPWERAQEAQMGTRAITQIGAGVKVWRPGRD